MKNGKSALSSGVVILGEKKPSLLIAQLSGGGSVSVPGIASVIELLFACQRAQWPVTYEPNSFSGIERTRNILASEMLRAMPDCTTLVCLDRDVGVRARDVMAMVASGFDVCGGAVPGLDYDWTRIWEVAQQIPREQARGLSVAGMKPVLNITEAQLDRPRVIEGLGTFVECNTLPTGCLCVSRRALERFRAHYDCAYRTDYYAPSGQEERTHWSFFQQGIRDPLNDTPSGRSLTEDYLFCRRWSAMHLCREPCCQGLPAEVWCFADAKLRHVGRVTFQSDVAALLKLREAKKRAEAARKETPPPK